MSDPITKDHLKQLLETAMNSYNTHNDTLNRLVKYFITELEDKNESIIGYRYRVNDLREQVNACGEKLKTKYEEEKKEVAQFQKDFREHFLNKKSN